MADPHPVDSIEAVHQPRTSGEPIDEEAAPPWEPLKLGKWSGRYDVPWPWWDRGEDGRDR